MTSPTTDWWSDLPFDGSAAEALSSGILLADSEESAATVRRIVGWMRRYCGWHVFGEVAESVAVDGTGTSTLHLPTLRVVDITAVTESVWGGSEIATTARSSPADYTWSVHGIIEKRSGVWTRERQGVHVTLTHGFDMAPDVAGVVVAASVRHAGSPDGNALARVGDIAYQSSGAGAAGGSAFLQSEYAVLDAYRLNPEV